MTPKEKAEKLVSLFYYNIPNDEMGRDDEAAKECALIAIDEILESLGYKSLSDSPYTTLEARQYYVQVKHEIEKL